MLDMATEGMCDGPLDLLQEEVSPSGDKIAVAHQTSCGATTGYTPRVIVLIAGDTLVDSRGLVPRKQMEQKGYVFYGPVNGTQVDIHWLSDTILEIRYYGRRESVTCQNTTQPPVEVVCVPASSP